MSLGHKKQRDFVAIDMARAIEQMTFMIASTVPPHVGELIPSQRMSHKQGVPTLRTSLQPVKVAKRLQLLIGADIILSVRPCNNSLQVFRHPACIP